ncbi:MAG: hypothetical protein K2L98_00060 [Bacilli bacterium]|nr:hypothetical protein [Bacilli bacterium]
MSIEEMTNDEIFEHIVQKSEENVALIDKISGFLDTVEAQVDDNIKKVEGSSEDYANYVKCLETIAEIRSELDKTAQKNASDVELARKVRGV